MKEPSRERMMPRSVTHGLLTHSVSRDPRRVVHRTPLPGTVAAEAGSSRTASPPRTIRRDSSDRSAGRRWVEGAGVP